MPRAEQTGGSMGTLEGLTAERKEMLALDLNALLMMECDALALYDEVIDFFEEDEQRVATLEGFRNDHERHVDELTGLVDALGVEPLPADETSPFGELVIDRFEAKGVDDGMALLLFKVTERSVKARYEAVLAEPLPDDVREVIQRAVDDETRHSEWAAGEVEDLEVEGREE